MRRPWLLPFLLLGLMCGSTVMLGAVPAEMTSPTPGSALTGSSATFMWTTGTGVSGYWLWVGTAPGTVNLYDASQGTNTSVTVNGLPTNGSTIYVRLFSSISGAWQYNDYTYTAYTAPPQKAAMSSPVAGSTLTGSSVQFTWTPGTSVVVYWLWVGTAPGTLNLYDASQGNNTSVTVNGLPTNGSTIYVRLFSSISGAWQYNDYTYTAYTAPPQKAAMSSPVAGSTLTGSSVQFTWTPGTNVAAYWMWVGTAPGTVNLYDASQGTNTSVTVDGLPANGSTIYVRLFSSISGAWQYNDYTYTAYTAPPEKAVLISSIRAGSSVQFTWTAGTGVSVYWLWIGSAPGKYNYYDASQGKNTSATVNGLPVNGSTVYVRLFSWINGAWQYNDYSYIAKEPKNLSSNAGTSSDPQVAVSADGSVVNVVWEDDTPGNFDIFFARSTDGGDTFSAPLNLSNDSVNSRRPLIAADSTGNVINIIWENRIGDYTYDIVFRRSSDGGTFAAPKSLGCGYGVPDMALDSSGNINVVWVDCSTQQVVFNRSTDGGATFSMFQTLPLPSRWVWWADSPQITVDSSNHINVVWTGSDGNLAYILFNRSADGGASFSAAAEVGGGWSFYPQMAVGSDGNINVVWTDYWDLEYPAVYFSRSTDGGATFSYPTFLSYDWGPQIATDAGGGINILSNATFMRSTDAGGSFSTTPISTAADHALMALDGGGKINVVWSGDGEVFHRSSTNGGGTFSVPANLSNNAGLSSLSAIALDDSGRVYVVWRDDTPGNSDIFFIRY